MSFTEAAEGPTEHPQATIVVGPSSQDSSLVAITADPEVFIMPRNPQACLANLPEELVAQIVEYLPSKPLDQFSRTNKRNKRIADASLYSEIDYGTWQKMRPVASNTELSKNVKTIKFELDLDIYEGHSMCHNSFLTVLTNAINLQRLCIVDDTGRDPEFLTKEPQRDWLDILGGKNREDPRRTINTFANLTSVNISSSVHAIEDLEEILRLPALAYLRLEYVYQTITFDNWTIIKSRSPIKTLELHVSSIDSEALAQLLSYIKALDTFHYSHRTFDEFTHIKAKQKPRYSWTVIGDALRGHQNSLSNLFIHGAFHEDYDAKLPEQSGYGTIGSLRKCQNLRAFDIEMQNFTHLAQDNDDLTKCLPSNMEFFGTLLVCTDLDPYYCATAIGSLKDVLTAGSDRRLAIGLPKGSPYGRLRLSSAIESLLDSGIDVEVCRPGRENDISIDTLRLMEADGYEDPTSSEDDDSDDPDVEEFLGPDWDDEEWDYDGKDDDGTDEDYE